MRTNERDIFDTALQIPDEGARSIYLREACGDNELLRDRVRQLLKAEQQLGDFLTVPLPDFCLWGDRPGQASIAEAPGTVIGSYKLIERIGEGGMGVVYLAEQSAPVRRRVALKIIKPGMDTSEVIARFEAERQALALMDHPNIARVFDGGTTESGRPYFVMEPVLGVPMTEYCDRHNLSVRERLQLFVTVCHAVQHAHQKGIVHRDIKPSNVLVTQHDGRAVPKVIDFGVAKAIGVRLTERTLFTLATQLVGTPLYMSPEQAATTGQDIDTRADVFSLGTLLYELLTATTPIERGRMSPTEVEGIRRLIRLEDPPPPSVRLHRMADQLEAEIAARRQVDPKGLIRLVRGDLDWIVMRAIEKDRTRRYQTASDFARDIERFLAFEPVEACPPSSLYAIRKFARRNRGYLTATALVIAGLIVAVVVLGVSNAMIREEQQRTREERKRALLAQETAERRAAELRQGIIDLQTAHRLVDRGRLNLDESSWDDADAAFTKAIGLRPEYAGPWEARSDLYVRLGLFDLAVRDLDRAYEFQQPENWRWMALALLRLNAGDVAGWRNTSSRIRQKMRERSFRVFDVDAVRAAVLQPNQEDDAREMVELARVVRDRDPGNPFHRYIAGLAHYRADQYRDARAEFHEALTSPADWPARRIALPGYAMALYRLGRDAEARGALADAGRAIDEWTARICQTADRGWEVHQGVGAWPIPWWDWLECRLFYREAKLLIDGTPPPEDPRLHVIRARSFAGLRKIGQALSEYDAALARLPNDIQLQFERARMRGYYFGYVDWPRAALEFAEARRLAPNDCRIWNFEAVARLASGDVAAYRRLCEAMLDRFGDTKDPGCAENIAYTCVLRPDSIANPARLIPVAHVAARLYYGNTYIIGAACCRAGEYEEAIRQLDVSARCQMPRGSVWCFMAIAHHRLGHAAQARSCLGAAARWIAQANQAQPIDSQYFAHAWGGFTERFEVQQLYNEAAALIETTASANATP